MYTKITSLIAGCILSVVAFSQPVIFSGYDLNTVGSSSPQDYTVVGSNLFFSATTTLGRELWITNGLPNYGVMVKDIFAASPSSNPGQLIELNGKLIFSADNGGTNNGLELWISDGTEAGTMILKDIVMGGVPSNPEKFCVYNGNMYLIADTFFKGREIWVTDGTTVGSRIFKDINPGAGPCNFDYPHVFNGRLYFSASNGGGQRLWSTDGTDTGTRLVLPVTGGTAEWPLSMTTVGSKMYFVAGNGGFPSFPTLYCVDSSTAGIKLANAPPAVSGLAISYNNEFFYSGDGGNSIGVELYKTNGTLTGTKLIKEFFPAGGGTSLAWPCIYKNKLYFSADSPTKGKELWVTDGTTAGTTMVKDIIPGIPGGEPTHLTVYKDHLYFVAQDSAGNYQVYRSDGTNAGTQMIQPPNTTVASPASPANGFKGFTAFNGSLFYTANYTVTGSEMWSLQDTSTPIYVRPVINRSNDVLVYPNPNNGSFTLQLSNTDFSSGNIVLYDMVGRKAYERKLDNQSSNISVNCRTLSKGIYQLRVMLDDYVITNKLVVQ